MRLVVIVVVVATHVLHGALIATAESVAIIIALFAWHRGMAKCLVVIRVRVAVPLYVMACRFNAFLKSLTPRVAELIRRCIPGTFLSCARCDWSSRRSDCVRPYGGDERQRRC